MTPDESDFTVEIFQNEYLPDGAREVNAIVTVTAPDTPGRRLPAGGAGGRAEIIIIDCSGSMDSPHAKIVQARAATAAALDVIRRRRRVRRDRRHRGGAAGLPASTARWPSPTTRPGTRPSRSWPACGRAAAPRSGTWLRLARQMFASSQAALRHAILLTDGKNEHETPEQLDAAIAACEGVFSCDCRGVGTDWQVGELRRISTALLGTVDIVPDPAGLTADFEAMMETAMGKAGRRRGAAGLDAAARDRPVRQAGRPDRRGPDRPPHRRRARRPATTRPARGEPARAATTTSASRSTPPRSARRCSPPG